MKRKVADFEIAYGIDDDIPNEIILTNIDEDKMKNEDIGFVVDTTLTSNRNGLDKYQLQNMEGERFEVEIPEQFDYYRGDAVLEKHVYNHKCINCKNDMMYDSYEEEWYCPLGHDS